MTPQEMNEALKSLKDYWFVLIFIGTIIVTWTQFDSRITANEKNIIALETQAVTSAASLVVIQTNIAEIKATLEFIKNNLGK